MSSPQIGTTYIHYNPERTDFTISEDELGQLEKLSRNPWKEFFLVVVSMSIPCTINAITLTPKDFSLTLGIFLNYLFGGIGIMASIIFAILWGQTRKNNKELIEKIKGKPVYMISMPPGSGATAPTLIYMGTSTAAPKKNEGA